MNELRAAWSSYKKNRDAGWELIQEGERRIKEASGIPANGPITVWFMGSHMIVEAMEKKMEGYRLRREADRVWKDDVFKVKGDVRVDWEIRGDDIKCTLESGEVFE